MTSGQEDAAARAGRWSPRLAAAAPVLAAASIAVGLIDDEGGESPIAASALAIAFVGVGAGLGGLFTLLLAREKAGPGGPPRWVLPCALCGIAACFLAGILGLVT